MELSQNNKLLSVIVAIYNKQKYLDKCIKSILEQTRKNIEIILVDDGSDDESPKICERYASEDKRIKLIKKNNEGQVIANKMALRCATGNYITFVDADDYIEPWLFEYEMDLIERYDTDMVCSGYIRESGKNSTQINNSFNFGKYMREELESTVFPDMMFHREKIRHGIDASLCTKIFKRDILAPILENENESISLGEDIAVVYWYITKCNSIYISDICGYHYVEHDTSITSDIKYGDFEKLCILKDYLNDTLGQDYRRQIDFYIYSLLGERISKIYNINIMQYEPPVDTLPLNSKLVLYGAGNVGIGYYKYLQQRGEVEIVAWADQNVRNYLEYSIIAPEDILKQEYDVVLVAITDEDVAKKIEDNLISLGVVKEKIIWRKPKLLLI